MASGWCIACYDTGGTRRCTCTCSVSPTGVLTQAGGTRRPSRPREACHRRVRPSSGPGHHSNPNPLSRSQILTPVGLLILPRTRHFEREVRFVPNFVRFRPRSRRSRDHGWTSAFDPNRKLMVLGDCKDSCPTGRSRSSEWATQLHTTRRWVGLTVARTESIRSRTPC